MGHYCSICGRTRANEKFLGKGHKNHVYKDCSGKSGRKAKMDAINETISDLETFIPSDAAYIQSENTVTMITEFVKLILKMGMKRMRRMKYCRFERGKTDCKN